MCHVYGATATAVAAGTAAATAYPIYAPIWNDVHVGRNLFGFAPTHIHLYYMPDIDMISLVL